MCIPHVWYMRMRIGFVCVMCGGRDMACVVFVHLSNAQFHDKHQADGELSCAALARAYELM